jgi:hypothetical protein
MSMNHWERYGPAPEAYSRVTNPERFRPLHTFMVELICRLEAAFDVERLEGYGLDGWRKATWCVQALGWFPAIRVLHRSSFRSRHSPDSESGLVVGMLTPFPVAGVMLAMKRRTVKLPVWFKWWTT